MKKRREFFTKALAGAMTASMVIGTLPATAMAASSAATAKDGTWTGTATVIPDGDKEFTSYPIEVEVKIGNGKITDVAFTDNNTYYGEGATRNEMVLNPLDSQDALAGLKDLIISNNGTDGIEARIDSGSIDAVTGATCSAYAILDAVDNAITNAEEEAQVKYIAMNVPYADFYEAYDLDDVATWEVEPGIDAVSTATTSKFMGSTAKGTYNDGKYILGVTIPVAVTEDVYETLDTLNEGEAYYFTDLEEVPDAYSELTVNEDGSYSFSGMQDANINTEYLEIGEVSLIEGYGDYQVDLVGISPSNGLQIGENQYVDYTVYGVILNTADGKKYGMTAMENIWNGSRFPYVQVAWSIIGGQGLCRGHGSGDPFYQFDMNGATLTDITVITNLGIIDISCGENGLILPEYYTGDLSALTYSVAKDSTELSISGIPEDLEDVTITVSDGLATNAEVVDGKVALTGSPVDGTNYTITISSSNFPDITRTVSTPISDAQKAILQYWVDKALMLNDAMNAADLKEHVEEAQEMIANETASSAEAEVLIGELIDKVKTNYPTAEAAATLKGSVLTVALDGAALTDLQNPVYTLSYLQRRDTITLTSGSFHALSMTLDAELTVGTEYTLTIVSDNYQDITTTVTAEAAAPVVKENGLANSAASDGKWYYYADGEVAADVTTVAQNEKGWWYVKNGVVDFTYTGIAQNEQGWWRIVNGKVDFGCNSVEKNEKGWWYLCGGKVDFTYTGVAQNAYGWWRIVNGKVDFGCNSVEKNEKGWWYLRGGKVDFTYTGVAQNAYGWWRIVNGKVDFGCNSVEKNENGWWKIENGKVNFNFNGIAQNQNGWWYMKGGKVDFSYNGTVPANGQTYIVTNGKVAR